MNIRQMMTESEDNSISKLVNKYYDMEINLKERGFLFVNIYLRPKDDYRKKLDGGIHVSVAWMDKNGDYSLQNVNVWYDEYGLFSKIGEEKTFDDWAVKESLKYIKSFQVKESVIKENEDKDISLYLRRRVTPQNFKAAVHFSLEKMTPRKHGGLDFEDFKRETAHQILRHLESAISDRELYHYIGLNYEKILSMFGNMFEDDIRKRYEEIKGGGIHEEMSKMKRMMDSKKSEQNEGELTEKCWTGYKQKGMKTMFGKRYPNCVKNTKK